MSNCIIRNDLCPDIGASFSTDAMVIGKNETLASGNRSAQGTTTKVQDVFFKGGTEIR